MEKKVVKEVVGRPFYDTEANDYYYRWFGVEDEKGNHITLVEMLEKAGWDMWNLPDKVRIRVEIEVVEYG